MKAWKVLYNGKYSAVVSAAAGVTYSKKKTTTAPNWLAEKGYHLTAFDTLKNAMEFKLNHEAWEVWEVEAEDQVLPLPPMADPTLLTMRRLVPCVNDEWPPGTLMFKKITLIKRIV